MTVGVSFERVDWDDHRGEHLRQQMVAELVLLYLSLEQLSAPGSGPEIDPPPWWRLDYTPIALFEPSATTMPGSFRLEKFFTDRS